MYETLVLLLNHEGVPSFETHLWEVLFLIVWLIICVQIQVIWELLLFKLNLADYSGCYIEGVSSSEDHRRDGRFFF